MKTMNIMMPFMSLIFAFTVPLGLTIYWIAGALVRTVQQVFLNRHFAKINLDTIIEANKEKAKKKAEKRGIRQAQIYNAANIRTRNTNTMSGKANSVSSRSEEIEKANEIRKNAKKGSMASKANLVSDYNSKNTKK